jgi:hypothetical protein
MKECIDCFHFWVCGEPNQDPTNCKHFCERDEQEFIISDKLFFCPGNCINDYETGYTHAIERTNSPVVYAYWLVETEIDNTKLDMTIDQIWHCSHCNTPYHNHLRWYKGKRYKCGINFCPECGATMLGFKVAPEKKDEEE